MARENPTGPVRDPLIGTRLDDRYDVEEMIGRGGMGSVYRAIDIRLERTVAIKVLGGGEPADEVRFRDEVRTLARLAHPNLVRVFDAGEVAGRPFLVMELVDGSTLARKIADGPLSPEDVAQIGADVAAGLAAVHAQGIVHRDVKPANVLLDRSGRALLVDFGIARLVDTAGITATGLLLGTPAYLAPEQVAGGAVGPAADIYALGLMLLESLTGTRAFEGTTPEVAAARLHRDPVVPPTVPGAWRALITAMTGRDPSARPEAPNVVRRLEMMRSSDLTVPLVLDATVPIASSPSGTRTMTVAIPPGSSAPSAAGNLDGAVLVRAHRRPGTRRAFVAAAVLAVCAAVTAFITSGSGQSPSSASSAKNPAATLANVRSNTTVPPPSTTTTTSTTTTVPSTTTVPTTTLPPTVDDAANTFLVAVQNGTQGGTISPFLGAALTAEARVVGQLADAGSPGSGAAFDHLAATVQSAIEHGQIADPATRAAVNSTLATLSGALNAMPPPTTVAPVPPPGPGPGHGHGGKGHGPH